MSKMTKNVLSFALVAVMSFVIVAGVNAQTDLNNIVNIEDIQANSGLSNTSANDAIANVIKLVLGLLGAIALVIIIIGGFKWMTSGGDDGKIGEAKKLMGAGIVGMIIILVAYIASNFIVSAITGVVGTEEAV